MAAINNEWGCELYVNKCRVKFVSTAITFRLDDVQIEDGKGFYLPQRQVRI
ncbi:hypothetical protein SAMN02744775_02983 [Enterobacter sp. CC120223-11]|nr:hypothetical protein SAMN02744775_02983 [Enterobacter sp. CC120223-11]